MIGPKSTSPMPGPRRLTSWAWKWPAFARVPADQLGDGRPGLAALGLHVHVELEVGVVDPVDQGLRLGAGVEEVGLAGGQRLEAEVDPDGADGRA